MSHSSLHAIKAHDLKTKSVMLNAFLIGDLKKQYPRHDRELALAAHCIKIASLNAVEKNSLFIGDEIDQVLLVEWLLGCVDHLPESVWSCLRDAVVLMFEFLVKQHPEDIGLFMHIMVLSNPDGYSLQKRINMEEQLIDLLLLDGEPKLMAAIGLSSDCVRDHSVVA